MSSRWLEGYISLSKKDWSGYTKQTKTTKEITDEKFTGAYVQEPQSGKHDWVYDLDITSMYPSVIRSLKYFTRN